MSRFIKESDYDTLIRSEIKNILLEGYDSAKLHGAEQMAIAQIRGRLAGRYDVDLIFAPLHEPAEGDNPGEQIDSRNAFIIMSVIDCALYHLYCSIAPNKIPEHRSTRYQDVIEWLKDVGNGKSIADLPQIKNEITGEVKESIRITSRRTLSESRW